MMLHEKLYQYSSQGWDFSTCLQNHIILLQFLNNNIAKKSYKLIYDVNIYEKHIHKLTDEETVINGMQMDFGIRYLSDLQSKRFCLLCLQSLNSMKCLLQYRQDTFFVLQITFMFVIIYNCCGVDNTNDKKILLLILAS